MSESFVFIGNSEGCVPLATSLMQAGYRNAESLEEADAVFVYCIGQSIHEDAFFEEEGILATVGEGKLIIDLVENGTPIPAFTGYDLIPVTAENVTEFYDAYYR